MRVEGQLACRDLVVFVPGLMGSVLEREGEARHAVFAAGVSADLSPRYRVAKTD